MAQTDNTVLQYGRVGPASGTDGSFQPLRLDKFGALVLANGHGRYYEPASRGKLFAACTAVAGVAPGTALSTTPPMAIWNPTGSGINVAIKKVFMGYVSGTLGAGTLVHAQVAQASAPTGGTELTPVQTLLGGGKGLARAFQGSTVAATPTIVLPGLVIGAFLATTAIVPGVLAEDLESAIVVAPGQAYVHQGVAAAGTSPLVLFGVVYEEITLPS